MPEKCFPRNPSLRRRASLEGSILLLYTWTKEIHLLVDLHYYRLAGAKQQRFQRNRAGPEIGEFYCCKTPSIFEICKSGPSSITNPLLSMEQMYLYNYHRYVCSSRQKEILFWIYLIAFFDRSIFAQFLKFNKFIQLWRNGNSGQWYSCNKQSSMYGCFSM